MSGRVIYNIFSMRRVFLALFTALLAGFALSGADTPKTAFDKPTLEAYIRHLFVLSPQLTVTVNDPKPAAFAGFKEVRVRIAQGAQFQDVVLFVSNDGKQIVQGNFYDIAKNPFKPDLDKLKPQYSPALGTAGAPSRSSCSATCSARTARAKRRCCART